MLVIVEYAYIEHSDNCEWSDAGSICFTNQSDADAWIVANADWSGQHFCHVHDVDVVIIDPEQTHLNGVPCHFLEHTVNGWKSMDESIAYFPTADELDPAGYLSVYESAA